MAFRPGVRTRTRKWLRQAAVEEGQAPAVTTQATSPARRQALTHTNPSVNSAALASKGAGGARC